MHGPIVSPPLVRLSKRLGWLSAIAYAAGRPDLGYSYQQALIAHEATSMRARLWPS